MDAIDHVGLVGRASRTYRALPPRTEWTMSTESRDPDARNAGDSSVELHATGPMALVSELWYRWPPVPADAIGGDSERPVAALQRTLVAVALEATRLAHDGSPDDRSAARLLSETAGAVHDALGHSLPGSSRSTSAAGGRAEDVTPWKDRLRLARMERWLAARAEDHTDADPAASLCLWVIEHLEMAVPLPRRIPPA